MCSLALTTVEVIRFSAIFVGLASVMSGTDPVGRRTLAADGVAVRRGRYAASIAARASTNDWQSLRTMTVAIDDSRAKA